MHSEYMLKITLPELVLSAYAVPIQSPPADVTATVTDAVNKLITGPVRDITLQLLSGPAMKVKVHPIEQFPVPTDVLSVMGASQEQISVVANCTHYVAVQTVNIPAWPPYHELAGRAVAGAIAQELNTLVVDLLVPLPLVPGTAISCLPNESKPMRFADWLMIVSSISENGFWMSTKGLCRIGLPELQAHDVPPQTVTKWSEGMIGLAWNIVKKFTAEIPAGTRAPHLNLPDSIQLSRRDVAEATHSETMSGDEYTEIHLRLDDAGGSNGAFLTLVTGPEETRSLGEYLTEACEKLFGKSDANFVNAEFSKEMENAMATARASLSEIRERYQNNKLPDGVQLAIKFIITNGESVEYVWAFVTSWSEPNELQATVANDAKLDPNIRIGRMAQLNIERIVDWAVFANGEIVEGGFTNKVLAR